MALAAQLPFKRPPPDLRTDEKLDVSSSEAPEQEAEEDQTNLHDVPNITPVKRKRENDSPSPVSLPRIPATQDAGHAAPLCPSLPRDVWNIICQFLQPSELIAARFVKMLATLPSVQNQPKGDLPKAAMAAARTGSFSLLIWFHSELGMPWQSGLCVTAASAGRLDVLDWAAQNGCEWGIEAIIAAAAVGCKPILEWAIARGVEPERSCAAAAAGGGHLPLLKWLVARGCQLFYDRIHDAEIINCAASGGHLEVIKWAREQGCTWDRSTCVFAAEKGHLDLLKWYHRTLRPTHPDFVRLHANGCPITSVLFSAAADSSQLQVLEWASSIGIPWNMPTLQHIKDLEIIKWAVAHGLTITDKMCLSAARNGHLDVLMWAKEQGCPWNWNQMIVQACVYGRAKVAQWLLQLDEANYWPKLATLVARNNHLGLLQWLHEQGYHWVDRSVAKAAYHTRNKAMMIWVIGVVGQEVYEEAISGYHEFEEA